MKTPTAIPSRVALPLAIAFTSALLGGMAAAWYRPIPASAQINTAPSTNAYYTQSVQPILRSNCYRCHGAPNHRGGLQIDTRAGMLRGGHNGAVLVPGHPEQSLLIALIRHEGPADDPMPMPPKSKLSDADIATVTAWIKAGAIMPE